MAEIWPSLRKKLLASGDGKRKNSKSNKAGSGKASSKRSWKSSKPSNPYATIGLEKFASLLEELQSKQQAAGSLVERTASTLSAARSISRSAQEWTASTLVRTATRAHSSSPPTGAVVQSLPPSAVGEVQQVVENLSEERPQALGSSCSESQIEEVITSNQSQNLIPVGVRLPTTPRCCRVMKKSTRGAFVMLFALGAYISSRAGKVGKPLAAILSFSAVIRIWRKGKVSARFMFSSVALYLLRPLQSYVITHIPRQLTFSPHNQTLEQSHNAASDLAQPTLQDSGSLGLLSAPPASPILLAIPESPSSSSPISEPTLPKKNTASSPRRLAKKISSRLKKLKVFKSSSSSSSVALLTISSPSSSPSPSAPSISKPSRDSSSHHRKCPFSRHLHKKDDIPEASTSEPTVSTHHGCRIARTMRRQRSSESMSCTTVSRLGRRLSSETLEQYNLGDSSISSPCESKHSASSWSSHHVDHHHEAPVVAWRMVGLFVTLLFLVVGRVPAIMATSLFFVVVSPHSRARERENRALEAARKLRQRSLPQRWPSSSNFSRGSF